MTPSDETLMAFADGELDAVGRAAVEQAMLTDPSVAERVARHRDLRRRLQAASARALEEPVPERLLAAVRGGGNVVQLADARANLARTAATRGMDAAPAAHAHRPGWRPLGALAASLLLGLAVGYGVSRPGLPMSRDAAGALVAQGILRQALSEQLAAAQPAGAPVQVGLSYLSHDGVYCRSFTLQGTAAPAGIACRRGADWRIQALAARPAGEAGAYRTAASALPPALLKIVEEEIQGDTLDAAGELQARRDGWHHPP